MISEYLQKNDGTRFGALAAAVNDKGEITIGHSKWHKTLDGYDPKRGMGIAIGRAVTDRGAKPALGIVKHIGPFVARAKRYYKTDKFSANTTDMLIDAEVDF